MRLAQRQAFSSPVYAALMLEDDDTEKDIATILIASGARGHALGNDGRDSAVHICCENYARQSAVKPHSYAYGKEWAKEGPLPAAGPGVITPHGHAMELLQLLCEQQTSDREVAVSQTQTNQDSTENGFSRWLSRFSRQTNFCTFECQVTAPTHSEGATVTW